jgi:hypothetical protein
MQDKFAKDIVESARQFARFGLNIASSAVGYAAEVLRDVEKELKHSSDRFSGTTGTPGGSDSAPPSEQPKS